MLIDIETVGPGLGNMWEHVEDVTFVNQPKNSKLRAKYLEKNLFYGMNS